MKELRRFNSDLRAFDTNLLNTYESGIYHRELGNGRNKEDALKLVILENENNELSVCLQSIAEKHEDLKN